MTPNIKTNATGVLFEEEDDSTIDTVALGARNNKPENRPLQIVWRNVILFGYLHLAALYGLYLAITAAKWRTLMFAWVLIVYSSLGITAGVHRLWSHKSYKARWPLRLFLVIANTIAFQDAVVDWARDHRVHHKYSETDADPHNAMRGFFFSHVGWLLCRKHPDVKEKGKGIDMSDLYADPLLRFQKKYYIPMMTTFCFIMPTVIPWYFWNESFHNSWFVCAMFRYCYTLNITWLVNSAAHFWGGRPYDKNISPAENRVVALLAQGEGWHNYHHTFPWDYKTAELGAYSFNITTLFLDVCSKLGLAYDMKTVPEEVVQKRVLRTGDGTHNLWGWGDKDQTQEDTDGTIIVGKKDQ